MGRNVYPRTAREWSNTVTTKLNVLVQYKADLIIISSKTKLFSPWYSWNIAELEWNNNHWQTERYFVCKMCEKVSIFYLEKQDVKIWYLFHVKNIVWLKMVSSSLGLRCQLKYNKGNHESQNLVMFSCTNTLHDHNVCFISGQLNCIHFIPLPNIITTISSTFLFLLRMQRNIWKLSRNLILLKMMSF